MTKLSDTELKERFNSIIDNIKVPLMRKML